MPRIADRVLERMLHTTGAVHITGPKGCGKSTTGARQCRTEYRLQDPENVSLRMLAATKPSELFKTNRPILLDEWGEVPSLWDAVRNEVDISDSMGEFILTGSSVPKEDGYSHSGVDRIAPMRMRPMSLFESGDSNGSVSLESLFDGHHDISGKSKHTLSDIAYLTIRGGWPRSVRIDREYAQDVVMNYYNATIGIDVFKVDGKKIYTKKIGGRSFNVKKYGKKKLNLKFKLNKGTLKKMDLNYTTIYVTGTFYIVFN